MSKTDKIFWFLTVTIMIGLLLPFLVQDGMFLDGVTYSAISNNMAHGIGSLWNPHYTKTLYPNFHEHPALFFIIQSFFFKLLGEGIYTERIFTFLTAILTATGLVLCWNILCRNSDLKKYSWVAVLLWITTPIIFWSYRNNMLENLLSAFTLFSIYFILKTLIDNKIIYLLIGSIFIILAFLIKGPVGLFPVVVPLFYLLAFKQQHRWRTIIYGFLILLLTISIYFLITFLFPEIKQNITFYFEQQLIPALNNKREITANNRFSILVKLLSELALPLLILFSLVVIKLIKQKKISFIFKRESLFFLMVAISASIPLIISLKQKRYYLVPAIAFYILSIAFLITPFIKKQLDDLSNSKLLWIKRVSFLFFSLIILFSLYRFGKFLRDEEKLKDVYVISKTIPEGTIISTTRDTWEDWTLDAYMSRIGYLSLDCDHENEFYLIKKGSDLEKQLNERYSVMDLNLKKYNVLRKKPVETPANN
jgi:4-amino-4-deoxy-L-arabinose transferase-like glycosyltransferase